MSFLNITILLTILMSWSCISVAKKKVVLKENTTSKEEVQNIESYLIITNIDDNFIEFDFREKKRMKIINTTYTTYREDIVYLKECGTDYCYFFGKNSKRYDNIRAEDLISRNLFWIGSIIIYPIFPFSVIGYSIAAMSTKKGTTSLQEQRDDENYQTVETSIAPQEIVISGKTEEKFRSLKIPKKDFFRLYLSSLRTFEEREEDVILGDYKKNFIEYKITANGQSYILNSFLTDHSMFENYRSIYTQELKDFCKPYIRSFNSSQSDIILKWDSMNENSKKYFKESLFYECSAKFLDLETKLR